MATINVVLTVDVKVNTTMAHMERAGEIRRISQTNASAYEAELQLGKAILSWTEVMRGLFPDKDEVSIETKVDL